MKPILLAAAIAVAALGCGWTEDIGPPDSIATIDTMDHVTRAPAIELAATDVDDVAEPVLDAPPVEIAKLVIAPRAVTMERPPTDALLTARSPVPDLYLHTNGTGGALARFAGAASIPRG